MSKTIIERNPHNVANFLKHIVNDKMCEDGFKWYPEADEEARMGLFDINYAIEILEQAEVQMFAVESEE